MKYRFVGTSDRNFTKGRRYEIINFQIHNNMIWAFIADDHNEIVGIPYKQFKTFNQNWKGV